MDKTKIILVEDERDIRELMTLHLSREGFEVISTENGEQSVKLIDGSHSFDLAIFDWMLPGRISGLDLCKKYAGRFPILMVTARAETTDIILGLGMGADDYISKPFEIPVFLARVHALLRRASLNLEKDNSSKLRIGSLVLDENAYEASLTDQDTVQKLSLTPVEFKILRLLMKNTGRVLPRKQLLENIQGEDISVLERTIDVHVYSLRKKLGSCSDIIETVRGVGYRIQIK